MTVGIALLIVDVGISLSGRSDVGSQAEWRKGVDAVLAEHTRMMVALDRDLDEVRGVNSGRWMAEMETLIRSAATKEKDQ